MIQSSVKYFAKSDKRSLYSHCLDVALAYREFSGTRILRRRLASASGVPDVLDVDLDRLALLAGLHDAGKASVNWQSWMQHPTRPGPGHVAPLLAMLTAGDECLEAALGLDHFEAWFAGDLWSLLYATICHHGGPVEADRWAGGTDPMDPSGVAEVARIRAALVDALGVQLDGGRPLAWTDRLAHLHAGILMSADWLASGLPAPDCDTPEAAERLDLARAALHATGWQAWRRLDGAPRKIVDVPRPSQLAIADVPISERLVIIEDRTGSGKTEAAIIRALSVVAAGDAESIYFAVPTRSAAVELHQRVATLVAQVAPDVAGHVVRAVPGMLDTDGGGQPEPGEPQSWAVGCPRRVMAAPVAVGTIDQAMLSVLRARHAWLRRALLTRAVLIIDEVHAGDAYMHAVTCTLVREHLRDGGHVVLLSATLGESLRAELLARSPLSIVEAIAAPWPSIWVGAEPNALPAANVATRFELIDENALVKEIAIAHRSGAAVLVIRSTVSDAVATWSSLKDVLPRSSLLLHHSRWADDDRRLLDRLLTTRLGKGSPRGLGWIVVGTQTVEQSLDIDADLLITDACPADVLLQRRGRLHRHANHRPAGFEAARVLILKPDIDGVLAPGSRLAVPGQRGRVGQGWAFVYSALSVAATLRVLREIDGDVLLPRDARRLVEAATHPDALAQEAGRGAAWAAAWQDQQGAGYAYKQLADAGLLSLDAPYDDRQRPMNAVTRLGDGSVTAEVLGLKSPLSGAPLNALPVPARWLGAIEPGVVGHANGSAVRIGGMLMTYGEAGLMRG